MNLDLIYLIATCLTMALLNRIAGGGFVTDTVKGNWLGKQYLGLPGKPLYWIAVPVFGVALFWRSWDVALALTAAYVLWRMPSWGRWFTMDHDDPPKIKDTPSVFEWLIESISHSEQTAMFYRMMFVIPGILLTCLVAGQLSFWCLAHALAFSFWLWFAYIIGWGLEPKNGIMPAELFAGGFWGLLIVGMN